MVAKHYSGIESALTTEKSIRLLETENSIVFIVDRKLTKPEIKKRIEEMFNVKVVKVNTMITPQGKKKAIVKLHKDYKAMDIATKLGLI